MADQGEKKEGCRLTPGRFQGNTHAGTVAKSIPKAIGPKTTIPITVIVTPIRFSQIPVRVISWMRIRSVPKMIALGGVATASMNAKEQESVAGIIRRSGFTRMANASAARMGRNTSAVAVSDVSSVRNVINRQIEATSTIG